MNLKVKYTPVLVKEPEKVRDFLTQILGFSFSKNTAISDADEGILVAEKGKAECYLLLLKDTNVVENVYRHMIVNTDDCLKDYHSLISKGVKIIKKPEYTALGLAAEITDGEGNYYTLLEERNYIEN